MLVEPFPPRHSGLRSHNYSTKCIPPKNSLPPSFAAVVAWGDEFCTPPPFTPNPFMSVSVFFFSVSRSFPQGEKKGGAGSLLCVTSQIAETLKSHLPPSSSLYDNCPSQYIIHITIQLCCDVVIMMGSYHNTVTVISSTSSSLPVTNKCF